eukprot:TRINITY_DN984_c0_g1_i1.p1 TRINITY_DN984_c0_g1~~TRINITY_DN984_c0_g1_i1.p1  ORF type:complete len:388 (-),score=65.97 TRINITY_DN984_c0_g1_i1:349-1512(-)
MEGEMELEEYILKAPYECLSKSFRATQKTLEKEITQVMNAMNEIASRKGISREEALQGLEKLIVKLQGLKKKLEESRKEEEDHVQKIKARLQHLKTTSQNSNSVSHQLRWTGTRVDRVLVDYMLREGQYDSAMRLAESAGIQDLVDVDIFLASKKVLDGLSNHDATPGLAWCQDNRSRLTKIKSSFEFLLRKQEFIELIRADKIDKAIAYARKHFPPYAETNMREIQEAMGVLAFLKLDVRCERYRDAMSQEKWTQLATTFKTTMYQLYHLPNHPLLVTALQAGISALKTNHCLDAATKTPNCPVCQPSFQSLAQELPCSLHSHSSLVCRITGEIMDENNPPMALPNGYVYSKKAMVEMAAKNNGKVICKQTGAVFRLDELKKVFIT